MLIRFGTAADDPAIETLTRAAFAGKPYADDNDPLIPARLRADGDLLFDLVGVTDDGIVAHVSFSPALIDRAPGSGAARGSARFPAASIRISLPCAIRRSRTVGSM